MKKILPLFIFLFFNLLIIAQQNNLELLYQWTDDGTVLTAEENPGDNWVGNIYNEVWGFTQNGHEFAVIGSTQGTHIFDVTNPIESYLVASIDGASTSSQVVHRDFHTYNGYLYAVADEMESSTLQIMDVSNLPNSINVVYDTNDMITRSHNIFIDEANGIMYSCGGKLNGISNYLSLISLDDPENPVLLTQYNSHGYVHDIYVENNIGYLNAANNGVHIVDFSDVNNPQTLGSLTEYPQKGYNHSGWLSEDGNTYVFADENHGYAMKICDVSNPSDINVVTTVLSDVANTSIPHNLIIKDNLLYVSHYYDGLWIWDISNPANPTYVASYDTYPLSNGSSYKGAWGVYPLLPSGNILVSDMQSGLFVFAPVNNNSHISENDPKTIIFPNPTKDKVTLNLKGDGPYKVELKDIYGKLIKTQNSIESSLVISLKSLKNGIYFVTTNNTSNESQMIIKY